MRTFIKIEGLTDAHAEPLTRVLRAVEGVVDAEVSVEDAIASVLYAVRVDVATLLVVIKQAGYDARPL